MPYKDLEKQRLYFKERKLRRRINCACGKLIHETSAQCLSCSKKQTPTILKCLICVNEFSVPKCHSLGRKKYCSWGCRNKALRLRRFETKKPRSYISTVADRIRECVDYLKWRNSVYERDNWSCQKCGIKKNNLQAHHKKSFLLIIRKNKINSMVKARACDELWDISNGITLCTPCHKIVHREKDANFIQR